MKVETMKHPKSHGARGGGKATKSDPTQASDIASAFAELGLLGTDPDPDHIARVRAIAAKLTPDLRSRMGQTLQLHADRGDIALETFKAHFKISAAEGALLQSLIDGTTVVDHAKQADISVNTARTQMRSLLEKTAASGQLDLVRMYHAFKSNEGVASK